MTAARPRRLLDLLIVLAVAFALPIFWLVERITESRLSKNKRDEIKAACTHHRNCEVHREGKCDGTASGPVVGGYAGDLIVRARRCVAGRKTVIVKPSLLLKGKRAYAREGLRYVAVAGIRTFYRLGVGKLVDSVYYKFLCWRKPRTFTFRGEAYRYFLHRYNSAWRNERSVEVPIVFKIVEEYKGKNILEVGNVLNHYFDCQHDVLDKYEEADNPTIHQDAAHFHPSKKYDLIVSISTFEHIGWDEHPREPKRILYAIGNLIECLAPGGLIVATFPFGYHLVLDKLLDDGKHFTEQFYLKRVSNLKWVQIGRNEVYGTKYAIVIGIIRKATSCGGDDDKKNLRRKSLLPVTSHPPKQREPPIFSSQSGSCCPVQHVLKKRKGSLR